MNRNGYKLSRPADRWEEGMICGNGTIGAIVMGDAQRERIILSHERLVYPFNSSEKPIHMASHLPTIRQLMVNEKEDEAAEMAVDLFRREHNGVDGLVWTDPFIPASEIGIETFVANDLAGYERSLDFTNGEAAVHFSAGEQPYSRRVFVSRTAQCGVIQLDSTRTSTNYELTLGQTPYTEEDVAYYTSSFGYTPEYVTHYKGFDHAIVCIREFKGTNTGYATVIVVAGCDGQVTFNNESVSIKAAKNVLLLTSLIQIKDVLSFSAEEEINRLSALPASYERLLEEHKVVHMDRYARVSLSLPGHKKQSGNDEAIWQEARTTDKASPLFIEKIFNAGRYEILSSCGELPPNLQGVWAGSYHVPWSSDFTQNGNLPTAISSLLPSGDFESMHSYFDYQEANLDHYRENSRTLYGCRGIHIPSRTSSTGYDVHFSAEYPMLFWTAGAAWAAHFYYDYWLYTGDNEFFNKRALPFMKEAALFYEDYLVEDEDGHWLFGPSYSPENTPRGGKSSATLNATMDIAVAKELFTNLITGCRTLGLINEPIDVWERILAKMPAYQVNDEGALKEWAMERYDDYYDHRHASQLYMLYYDIPEEIKRDRVLFKACETAYRLKRERKKEQQGAMAFGLVQMGMAAAHLNDSEMVEIMLQSMARNNYYLTYASAHDYGPSTFNADISGGLPALILESIAQSSPVTDGNGMITSYDIVLLPALPTSLSSGDLKGLRLRGGFILDISWQEGKVTEYTVHNTLNKLYRVASEA